MKRIIIPIVFLLLICSYFISLTYSSGPPASYSGAPNEGNCTGCHAGTVNSGIALNNLLLSSSSGNTEYIPDSVYTITVSFSKVGCNRFGFQATVLKDIDNKMAGTLTVINASLTQKLTNSVSGSSRQYIEHTFNGTTPTGTNATSWAFNWKAPKTNDGAVHFYVAANAANDNGSNTGDEIYTKSFAFTPSAQLPVASSTLNKSTLCAKDTVKATGSATNNPTSWSWTVNPATGVNPSSSALQNPAFIFNSSGTYTISLVAKNAKGPSSSINKTVTVNPGPTATITPGNAVSLCEGDSVLLSSSSGTSYLWSNGKTSQSIYVKTSGTYSVEVSNASGCKTTSAPVSVTVHPIPVVSLSAAPQDTLCTSDTLFITATGGYALYRFYDGSVLIQEDTSAVLTLTDQPAGKMDIGVIAVSAQGCTSDTSARIVRWFEAPLAAPDVICDSVTQDSISFTWNVIAGATGYEVSSDSGNTWTSPSSGNAGLEHSIDSLPYGQEVLLMVRALYNAPCSKGLTGMKACSTLPCNNISYDLIYDTTICKGDSLAVLFSNLELTSYSISTDGSTYVQDSSFMILPDSSGMMQFFIIDSLNPGCPPFVVNFPVELLPLPQANFSFQQPFGSTIWFTDESFDAASWHWDFGDGGTDSIQNPGHTYVNTGGDYPVTLTVTNIYGCTDTFSVMITVQPNGINEISSSTIKIFPNPADAWLYCRIDEPSSAWTEIQLYDMTGKILLSEHHYGFGDRNNTIKLSVVQLDEGLYFLRIRNGNTLRSGKVQVRH